MESIPDVLDVANSGYTLLFENERLRVMKMQLKPGQVSPMHNHPNDHMVYILNDAKLKLYLPDGDSAEYKLKSGKILWIEAGSHETENIGSSVASNIVTEVK